MLRVEEGSLLEGFLMGRDRIRLSHLQFIDDTIFFSASMEDMQNLKLILLDFGNISRLEINLEKNTLYGINIRFDYQVDINA